MRLHKPQIYIIERRFSWSVETWAWWPFRAGASTSKKSFLSTCFQWETQDYGGQFCLDPDADCGWQRCCFVCLSVFNLIMHPLLWESCVTHTVWGTSPGTACPYSAPLCLCILWHHCFSSTAYSPARALPSGSTPRPSRARPLRARCRRQRAAAYRSRRPPRPGCKAGQGRAQPCGASGRTPPGTAFLTPRVRERQLNISLKKKQQTNKQTKKTPKNKKPSRPLLHVVNISIGKVWFLWFVWFPLTFIRRQ